MIKWKGVDIMDEQQHLNELAKETLDTFSEIESEATRNLGVLSNGSPETLASTNTWTSGEAQKNLQDISASNRDGYQSLTREPAISRVIAEDDSGTEFTFYISRTTSLKLPRQKALASYNSRVGRLASLPVGDDGVVNINNKESRYTIIEKTVYHPIRNDSGWDSTHNIFQHERLGTLTIESLRVLLELAEVSGEDELDKLLSGEAAVAGIFKGLAHQMLTAMTLRDQPILDKFQDDIFRLSIDSQLFILGPPGTGKTTTLIKRLGQKLDIENLEEYDQKFVINDTAGLPHNASWLVFTPSDLLKQYVKEAFSREHVPAPDDRIKTWESHSKQLARNVLGILKSNSSPGRFILKGDNGFINDEIIEDPRIWYDAFSAFHRQRVLGQLTQGISIAVSASSSETQTLISQIEVTLGKAKADSLVRLYSGLTSIEVDIGNNIEKNKAKTDALIKSQLTLQFNRNNQFLHELARYLESFNQEDEVDDDDRFDDDEQEELVPQSQTDIQKAERAFNTCIRNLSRYNFLKKSTPKNSRAARIRDWLGERVPDVEVLAQIGQGIALQNGLRRFNNASRRYVTEVAASYNAFRKHSHKGKQWYKTLPDNVRHISFMELDAMILLSLKCARELLKQNFVSRNIEQPRYYIFSRIASQFRNQILVDEATDFSALQLACMENLANLNTQSFFVCGDFNQRVTGYGIRNLDQVKWV